MPEMHVGDLAGTALQNSLLCSGLGMVTSYRGTSLGTSDGKGFVHQLQLEFEREGKHVYYLICKSLLQAELATQLMRSSHHHGMPGG